ncbi:Cell division protein DivIB [Clostridium liquoris]|jgi:cell division protein FtsQ|uniref:Cell division protein DivIB n=2 Tax=Clostridium liquoris TaxID=1289519 RepID=A0A2T0B4L6_9CLOT|nr:Cell division protein DivIB [Clostridium liquoris]
MKLIIYRVIIYIAYNLRGGDVMGEAIDFNRKDKNELIIKRRKKKFIKKCSLLLILLFSTLIILCLKHPYFDIKNIEVINNKNISKDEIIKLSGINKGDNIFYTNMDNIKNGIITNPYIMKVEIKRELPDTILINVKEREAVFYGEKDGKFAIVDKNGIVLEIRKDIKNMNLVKLQGFDVEKSQIGKPIATDDDRKLQLVYNISSLIGNRKDNYKIALVDIQDMNNIQFYYGNVLIKVGNGDDLDKKLNKAFNILSQKEEIKNAKKAYIDVSFDGNPVVFIEK